MYQDPIYEKNNNTVTQYFDAICPYLPVTRFHTSILLFVNELDSIWTRKDRFLAVGHNVFSTVNDT